MQQPGDRTAKKHSQTWVQKEMLHALHTKAQNGNFWNISHFELIQRCSNICSLAKSGIRPSPVSKDQCIVFKIYGCVVMAKLFQFK
jgi:hypothetical protein